MLNWREFVPLTSSAPAQDDKDKYIYETKVRVDGSTAVHLNIPDGIH